MPEQFSISTQAWNPGIFPPCRILISPRARASVVYRCGIHNAYLQFVCHQLAWYIILKFRFAEMLRRSIKMLSLVGRVAHLPDKAKQITALFDAAAVLQIGFKWKLSLWEYQAPWTIDQSDRVPSAQFCYNLQLQVLCENLYIARLWVRMSRDMTDVVCPTSASRWTALSWIRSWK